MENFSSSLYFERSTGKEERVTKIYPEREERKRETMPMCPRKIGNRHMSKEDDERNFRISKKGDFDTCSIHLKYDNIVYYRLNVCTYM